MTLNFADTPASGLLRPAVWVRPDPMPVTTPGTRPLAVASQPAQLVHVSFGAAAAYASQGGQPVFSDDCLLTRPVDLAVAGVEPRAFLNTHLPLVAAYRLTLSSALTVHAAIERGPGGSRTMWVRARCGDDIRVPETELDLIGQGIAQVDLPVVGLPLDQVGTIAEEWTWEYRTSPQPLYRSLLSAEGSDTLAVRIYVTAAPPLNAAPRWSFYHLACFQSGARTRRAAEAAVWAYFCRHAGGPWPTNVRGETLGFWSTAHPATAPQVFTQRDAQNLILQGDSSCFGWADLLAEALRIHGIPAQARAVAPQSDNPHLALPQIIWRDAQEQIRVNINGTGFIVRGAQWRHKPSLQPDAATGPWGTLTPGPFVWTFNDTTQPLCTFWPEPDVQVVRQPGYLTSHSNAVGMFANHAVVCVQDDGQSRWYDPSFGFGPHPDLLAYQHDLLGFGHPDCGGIFAIVGVRPAPGEKPLGPATLLLGARPAPPFLCIAECDIARKPTPA